MYDIVIIGSGPAGLSAAIYAQRENLKAVVVEKEFMGTGQIAESERVDITPDFTVKRALTSEKSSELTPKNSVLNLLRERLPRLKELTVTSP